MDHLQVVGAIALAVTLFAGREVVTKLTGSETVQTSDVRKIRRAIHKAQPHTPTNSNCYPLALTAYALLRCFRLASTFYYGVAFDADGSQLETHVWVRSGPVFVTGAPEYLKFATVGSYASTPRRGDEPPVPVALTAPAQSSRVSEEAKG
ncbi:MAG: lasso peptide biosynthesis B2 protein [Ilumatobacteraceae bacterium]|nr:lasso peptide biosynthesis B2 protein [Ilumatobacteraceae bacterium]